MKHTYLLTEGKWKANGRYYDNLSNVTEVYGETIIEHHQDSWILDGFMEVMLEQPIKFFNKYKISPIEEGKDYTSWESENPALGKLIGRFMIIGDTILSVYGSENGQYSGTETLYQVSENKYLNRGFAFNGEKKLSSWEVEIEMI